MKKMAMQNGTKEMIRNNIKVRVEFKNGVPHMKFRDSWLDEVFDVEVNLESLEEVEKYPYRIEIEAFSVDAMKLQRFTRYHKTESDAALDLKKFKVGDEYLDDVVIKNVKGPFRA